MITLTLQVTLPQAQEILNILNTSSDSVTEPVWPDLPKQDISLTKPTKSPSKASKEDIKASPKTGTKMPLFGRTKAQINAFNKEEQDRFEKQTEENHLKEQRKQEREAKKLEKEKEQQQKELKVKQAIDSTNTIKAAAEEKIEQVTLPKPTWKL